MTATDAQKRFINALIDERVVPTNVATDARTLLDLPAVAPRGPEIQQLILALKAAPKRAAIRAAAGAPAGPGRPARWDGIVVPSMYAVPKSELSPGAQAVCGGADYLFVQVRQYNGHPYMRKLTGAPGAFNRDKLATPVLDEALDIIRRSPVTYTDHFSAVYTCCGSCGAELTDARSIAAKLGPECRRKFGR